VRLVKRRGSVVIIITGGVSFSRLNLVTLVELDAYGALADAGNAVGKIAVALAAGFLLDEKLLLGEEIFRFANGVLRVDKAPVA
jgi:hypothetical protein